MIIIEKQFELNREWLYDEEDDEEIGERNFVISQEYLLEIFQKLFPNEKDIDEFLKWYTPEEDGEKIYQAALKDGEIIEEFDTYYDEEYFDEHDTEELDY